MPIGLHFHPLLFTILFAALSSLAFSSSAPDDRFQKHDRHHRVPRDPPQYAYILHYRSKSSCDPDSWYVARELSRVGVCFPSERAPGVWTTGFCGQEGHYGDFLSVDFSDPFCTAPIRNSSTPYYPDCTDFGEVEYKGNCDFSFPPNGIKYTSYNNATTKCGSEFSVTSSVMKDGACVPTGPADGRGDKLDVKSVMASCVGDGLILNQMFSDRHCQVLEKKKVLKRGQCDQVVMGGYLLWVVVTEGC